MARLTLAVDYSSASNITKQKLSTYRQPDTIPFFEMYELESSLNILAAGYSSICVMDPLQNNSACYHNYQNDAMAVAGSLTMVVRTDVFSNGGRRVLDHRVCDRARCRIKQNHEDKTGMPAPS